MSQSSDFLPRDTDTFIDYQAGRYPISLDSVLAAAKRTPGWNWRSSATQRFDLGDCVLLVVPARRWAYRRQEKISGPRCDNGVVGFQK